jgi:hypothetical protein
MRRKTAVVESPLVQAAHAMEARAKQIILRTIGVMALVSLVMSVLVSLVFRAF